MTWHQFLAWFCWSFSNRNLPWRSSCLSVIVAKSGFSSYEPFSNSRRLSRILFGSFFLISRIWKHVGLSITSHSFLVSSAALYCTWLFLCAASIGLYDADWSGPFLRRHRVNFTWIKHRLSITKLMALSGKKRSVMKVWSGILLPPSSIDRMQLPWWDFGSVSSFSCRMDMVFLHGRFFWTSTRWKRQPKPYPFRNTTISAYVW